MEKTLDDFIKEETRGEGLKDLILWSFFNAGNVATIIEKAADKYAEQAYRKGANMNLVKPTT